jgi:DNA replicative helicase MCM subunit Mcm2 (Cdc46/Mcm family)
MKIPKVEALIEGALRKNLKLLLVGKPGVGKSAVIGKVASKLSMRTIIIIGSMSDPTDVKGMPYVEDGIASFIPFGDLAAILGATAPVVVLLDDLGQTPLGVQTAFMHLIHAREINGQRIPDCVRFIAATNGIKDSSGVSGIIEPLKSRFDSIVTVEEDLEGWIKAATTPGASFQIHPSVIAFLRFAPQCFCEFKPTKDLVQSPSPRTWESASKWIGLGVRDTEVLSGCVGATAGAMLVPFLAMQAELPNIDAIKANPDGIEVPSRLDVLHSVCTALAYAAKPESIDALMRYIVRLPVEFQGYCVTDACRRTPVLQSNLSVTKWFARNGGMFL